MSVATTVIVLTTVISSFFLSLITGAGAYEAFTDITPPESGIDWVTFGFELLLAFFKLAFSILTFDIIPGLPTEIRVLLATVFGVILVKWFIQDVIPAIGSITPFT